MTYDIICLILVVLAFIGGFQKGVMRIFSFLIAICLSAIIAIWSAPYILDFLNASFSQLPPYTPSLCILVLFLTLSWLLSSLVGLLWKPIPKKKQNPVQNISGGVLLSAIMLLSIAILSGFFEQTKVISQQTKDSSYAYRILTPLHESSRQLWLNLTASTKVLKEKQPEASNEI